MENITPMLKQYHNIKNQYQNCILFFRLGDFYEMFYDDAKIASKILDVVLTSRGAGKAGKVPMCGIPYHAAENYIARLIKAGLKVAICEQVEDPEQARGIVKRQVIRVITSGTFIDENNIDSRYLLSLTQDKKDIGIAFTDLGEGIIWVNQYKDKNKLIEVISKLPIYECIFPSQEEEKVKEIFRYPLLRIKNVILSPYQDWCFNPEIAKKSLCEHFSTSNLKGFGVEDMPLATASAGALLEYTKQMNRSPLKHLDRISLYSDTDYVFISPAACYGLELEQLIKTIDYTVSPLGRRKLKYWVYHPLKDPESILKRQKAVTLLKNVPQTQKALSAILRNIPDIEKNLSRISCGFSTVKDIVALRNTITIIPQLQKEVTPLAEENPLFIIEDIPDLRELLEKAINPEVPLSHPEGKTIRKGYNAELDSLRDIQENGREWLKNLQKEEINRTGISSLKIGFNKIFGYYIEVSKPNLKLVPPDYIRKQTLVNAERFVTPKLKEFEEKMLSAEEKILKLENEIIQEIKEQILAHSSSIHSLSESIANIDALYSLSRLALKPGYTAPEINDSKQIMIKDGRHPVVEETLNESFVPNDVLMDCDDNHLLIITGPNMAGKSTYIRQIAILVILAQMGSYIPAGSSSIGVVDKIFTRIGAYDEITKGQSTFMVEMSETAEILHNLTERSLIVLDEIGRGTSTYDGLSLAWAVAEYLQKHKVRTLFATHFHELTALGEEYPGVKNYNVAVKEWNNEIIFLHKIVPGGSDESYGIYVAKLAGIPSCVIQRAKQILTRLEIYGNLQEKIRNRFPKETQLSLFTGINQFFSNSDSLNFLQIDDTLSQEIKKEIKELDINSLTPLAALNKIQEWKDKIERNGQSQNSPL